MKKKGQAQVVLIVIIIILAIALLGSGIYINDLLKTKPHFEKVSVNPEFIIPNDNNRNSADVLFIINNPTNIDFRGRIQIIYDEDCFSVYGVDQDVEVGAKNKNSVTRTLTARNYNAPEKCFKTHQIVTKLSNVDGTTLYSSKDFQLTITER